MKKGLGVVGLLAIPLLLVVMGKRKANAASAEAQPADLGAQYLAALQNNISAGGSFEEYHSILAEAASKGIFDPTMQTVLLGKHPDAPQSVKDNAAALA